MVRAAAAGRSVRTALRSFVRSPLFALTAVLSLAVGIGADTAIFTIANGLLLRPPAGITEPERLVDISGIERDEAFGINQISFPTSSISANATPLSKICAATDPSPSR